MARRTDPFGDIEELFDVMTGGVESGGDPPVDVAEDGDEIVVVADLPGYDREDVEVKLTDPTTLYVAATRETDAVTGADQFVRRERQRQSISRRITLPDPVDESETSATYENGVLTVTMAKRTASVDEGTNIPVE